MKTIKTLLAGAAVLGFVAATPAFASYARPEAGNTTAASYEQPQGNGNVVTAAVDAGATGRTSTGALDNGSSEAAAFASYADPETHLGVSTENTSVA